MEALPSKILIVDDEPDIVEFITRLDIDALADNQLSGRRADIVQRHIETNEAACEEARSVAQINDLLKIAKPSLYRDRDLRKTVEGLLRRRAA